MILHLSRMRRNVNRNVYNNLKNVIATPSIYADSTRVVISTSAWHTGSLALKPGHGIAMVYLVLKSWLSTLELCIPRELENHVNVGPASILDVNGPLSLRAHLSGR